MADRLAALLTLDGHQPCYTTLEADICSATEGEVSKKPKVEHDYHASKDKLTITVRGYDLKSKKTRIAILAKLMGTLESKPDRLIAHEKKNSKKGSGKKVRGLEKTSKLVEIGD